MDCVTEAATAPLAAPTHKARRPEPVTVPAGVRRPRAVAQHLLGGAEVAVFVDGYNFVFELWPKSTHDIGAALNRTGFGGGSGMPRVWRGELA